MESADDKELLDEISRLEPGAPLEVRALFDNYGGSLSLGLYCKSGRKIGNYSDRVMFANHNGSIFAVGLSQKKYMIRAESLNNSDISHFDEIYLGETVGSSEIIAAYLESLQIVVDRVDPIKKKPGIALFARIM